MHFDLQPSRVFRLLLGVSHVATLSVLWLIHWTLWLQLISSLVVVLNLLSFRHPIYRPQATITIEPNHQITLHHFEQEQTEGVLIHSVVTPFFVMLHIKIPKRYLTTTLLIFYDALPVDQFRELRVRLNLIN